jgi:DNA-3-methyladenine glycosylase I
MIKYHDEEWGVPVHDERLLFEYMILDAFQAGLSWRTVLYKRENFRKAFDNFNPEKIVKYGKTKYQNLLSDTGIIRNRTKINAAIVNAEKFLEIQKEFGSFDKYIWQFVQRKPVINKFKKLSSIPAKTRQSDEMSKDLKKKGFKFTGSTICYAFMQAAGMVNDHLVTCFRYKDLI